jgi:hypothetical protein
VNGTRIESDVAEAVLLSPAVEAELIFDNTTREFEITDDGVDVSSFSQVREIVLKSDFNIPQSSVHSVIHLCRHLKNYDVINPVIFHFLHPSNAPSHVGQSTCSSWISDELATHYWEYSIDTISLFEVDSLLEILSRDSLVIRDEDWLLQQIIDLGEEYSILLNCVRFEFLSLRGLLNFFEGFNYGDLTESIWERLIIRMKGECNENERKRRFHFIGRCIDSKLIDSLPSIFDEFSGKQIQLLYRGSRDGFGSKDFHSRCDGFSNTLTLIESCKGNIFGGYTPCAWDSTTGSKFDQSGRSFVFTLKNPHNIPPRKFRLVTDRRAIYCGGGDGPSFGAGTDIRVLDNCNAQNNNYLSFGSSYENDTGKDGKTLLDGEYNYMVKELEVFSISE